MTNSKSTRTRFRHLKKNDMKDKAEEGPQGDHFRNGF